MFGNSSKDEANLAKEETLCPYCGAKFGEVPLLHCPVHAAYLNKSKEAKTSYTSFATPRHILQHDPDGLPAGSWTVSQDEHGQRRFHSPVYGMWYFIAGQWYQLRENK